MGDDIMVQRKDSKLEKAFGAKKEKAPEKPKQKNWMAIGYNAAKMAGVDQ